MFIVCASGSFVVPFHLGIVLPTRFLVSSSIMINDFFTTIIRH